MESLLPRTEWYPANECLPLADRPGFYEIIEAHPLTPLDDDKIVDAWWGVKFAQLGFWIHEFNPRSLKNSWRMAATVLRWRGRSPTPRVLLTTPRVARVALIATPRVLLEV